MPEIQKIGVALTAEQVKTLKDAVETGEYGTTSEIVREALREWQWKRELRDEELSRMRELSIPHLFKMWGTRHPGLVDQALAKSM